MGLEKCGAGIEGILNAVDAEEHHNQFTYHGFAVGVLHCQLLDGGERDFGLIAAETVDALQISHHVLAAEFELLTAAAGTGCIRIDGHRWHL